MTCGRMRYRIVSMYDEFISIAQLMSERRLWGLFSVRNFHQLHIPFFLSALATVHYILCTQLW